MALSMGWMLIGAVGDVTALAAVLLHKPFSGMDRENEVDLSVVRQDLGHASRIKMDS